MKMTKMKKLGGVFLWLMVCSGVFVDSHTASAINIHEAAADLAFPHNTTWETFTPNKASYLGWIRNVIDGIRGGAARHISLAKMEIFVTGENEARDIMFQRVFVSGCLRRDVKQDIVGAVSRPSATDFWEVFQDIGAFFFRVSPLRRRIMLIPRGLLVCVH